MPQGLEVFDASGVSVFNTSDKALRMIDSFMSGTVNGSKTYTVGSNEGSLSAVVYQTVNYSTSGKWSPRLKVSGNTVTWEFIHVMSGRQLTAEKSMSSRILVFTGV